MNEKITIEQLTVAFQSEGVGRALSWSSGAQRLSESYALELAMALHAALYPKRDLGTMLRKIHALRKQGPWPTFGLPIDNEFTRQMARDAYNSAIDEVLDILGEP